LAKIAPPAEAVVGTENDTGRTFIGSKIHTQAYAGTITADGGVGFPKVLTSAVSACGSSFIYKIVNVSGYCNMGSSCMCYPIGSLLTDDSGNAIFYASVVPNMNTSIFVLNSLSPAPRDGSDSPILKSTLCCFYRSLKHDIKDKTELGDWRRLGGKD
jgi:hypothetical protein